MIIVVKYIGTRLKDRRGITGRILNRKDDNGVWIRWNDGKYGSATPKALQLVRFEE